MKPWKIDKRVSILHLKKSTHENLGCVTIEDSLYFCRIRIENGKTLPLIFITGIAADLTLTYYQQMKRKR